MIARLLRRVMPPRREPVHVPPPPPTVRYGIATCPVTPGQLERRARAALLDVQPRGMAAMRRDTDAPTDPHRRRLSTEEVKERLDKMRATLTAASEHVVDVAEPSQKYTKR